MQKILLLLATMLTLPPALALGQTTEELNSDGKNSENVLTQSMGLDRKNYSPLAQINKSNIKRLVPIWSTSLMNESGELAAPVVYDGVIYAINARWTFAINVENGRQIWRTPVQYEPGSTRAATAVYRGAPAIYNGKLFRITADNHLVALEMKTGRVLWNQKYAEAKEGYHSSGAPIVANGVLISGMAGGESTTRGFLDGWNPNTGEKLWRRYTIPAPGEPGSETWPANSDAWKYGGGPTWRSGSYDLVGSHTIRGRAKGSTVFIHRACSRSGRRPARLSATTNTRRTTFMTWTVPTSTCWPIFGSTDRCARS